MASSVKGAPSPGVHNSSLILCVGMLDDAGQHWVDGGTCLAMQGRGRMGIPLLFVPLAHWPLLRCAHLHRFSDWFICVSLGSPMR